MMHSNKNTAGYKRDYCLLFILVSKYKDDCKRPIANDVAKESGHGLSVLELRGIHNKPNISETKQSLLVSFL